MMIDEERRRNLDSIGAFTIKKMSIPWEKLYPEPAQRALYSNQSILAELYPPM